MLCDFSFFVIHQIICLFFRLKDDVLMLKYLKLNFACLINANDLLIFYCLNIGNRKVHFLLENGAEMVEEYNMDTNVVMRRIWKKKNSFGTDIGWTVEIGDPEPKENNIEIDGIQESSNTVCCFSIINI